MRGLLGTLECGDRGHSWWIGTGRERSRSGPGRSFVPAMPGWRVLDRMAVALAGFERFPRDSERIPQQCGQSGFGIEPRAQLADRPRLLAWRLGFGRPASAAAAHAEGAIELAGEVLGQDGMDAKRLQQ